MVQIQPRDPRASRASKSLDTDRVVALTSHTRLPHESGAPNFTDEGAEGVRRAQILIYASALTYAASFTEIRAHDTGDRARDSSPEGAGSRLAPGCFGGAPAPVERPLSLQCSIWQNG